MIPSSPARGSISARPRALLLALVAATLCLAAACTTSNVSLTPTSAITSSKLAYVQDGNVWVMTLPGGSPLRITTGGQAIGPSWSPSGRWLAYGDGAGTRVVRADGSAAHDAVGFSVWSPVDDRFVGIDNDGTIYVENADGSGHRIVVPPLAGYGGLSAKGRSPAWSPDGRWLAYTVLQTSGSATPPNRSASLWFVRVDGGQPVKAYDAGSPSHDDIVLVGWSPNGRALLFGLDTQFSASLLADGVQLRSIDVLPSVAPSPAALDATVLLADGLRSVQPGGAGLAITDGGGRYTWTGKRIAIVSASGATVGDLTPPNVAAIDPAWSPNGKRIAYVAAPDAGAVAGGDSAKAAMAKRRIWVMDADGSNQQQLTNDPAYRDESPHWLANGSQILFVRLDARDNASLWLEPATGGAPTRIVDHLTVPTSSTATQPFWFGDYGSVSWDTMFSLWSPLPTKASATGS